ncbi:MAG: NUDIX domain-containing protein [Candidatus Omnitrophica bacterium]|nr:NUDIX domain-containing protein [Candidatus Omnitrophota bacterium]
MRDRSYGIIPYSGETTGRQYLLIRHRAGHWGFPKGHAEDGETPRQAAVREFEEETGLCEYRLLPGAKFEERYDFDKKGRRVRKTVTYFLAEVRGGTVRVQEDEIADHAWLTYESAGSRITFSECRRVLDEAHGYLSEQAKE